jgi:tRNA (cytosine34-C5)-methyltransferase
MDDFDETKLISKRPAASTEGDKRKKRRKRHREAKKKQIRDERPSQRSPTYVMVVKENKKFEDYYKTLGIVPLAEWDKFISCLQEPLPATFRLTGCRSSAVNLLRVLEEKYFKELQEIEVEGERVPPPKPLSWYPDQLAWHVDLTRKFIRKSPLMGSFHQFLVNETELGNISRQEAVSMIPPLLLDVKPHHRVLDMCAAPGSKTAQIIESLHAEDTEENPVPAGVVVANDADNKRCYMLVHQAKRLNSPCVMVTNHDATVMPNMYYHHTKSDEWVPLVYDRILCDVPCSGDGTLRKNATIWKTWSPGRGLGLHKLQLSILLRGLELLGQGGRLVYSTCSLNPVENEAVISAALKWCKGTVELVDTSGALPALKCIPGLTSWKVMAKDGSWFERMDSVPKHLKDDVPSTAFPPSCEDDACSHLDRCMRLLPHHEDSGGFFVAVLYKKSTLPWRKKEKSDKKPNDVSREDQTSQPHYSGGKEVLEGEGKETKSGADVLKKTEGSESIEKPTESPLDRLRIFTRKKRNRGFKEDPFVFVEEGNELWEQIRRYYRLAESFPTQQMLTRSETGKKRNFYFSSSLVRELTIRNEHSVKIINIGTKTFARCTHKNAQCEFRLVQEVRLQTYHCFVTLWNSTMYEPQVL